MASRPLIEGCSASGLCNLTLGESSPTYTYYPIRDGPSTAGWNASYTGSTTYVSLSNGIDTPYRITRLNGASFQLNFHGTAVYLCLAMSTDVTYTLAVDGQLYNTTAPSTDPACYGDEGVQLVAYADGLSTQSHSVNFTVALPGSGSALSFYGGVVTLNVASAGTNISDPIYIDDRDSGWTYNNPANDPTGWDRDLGDATNYNGTHSFTCTYDAASTATYTVPIGAVGLMLIGTPDANTFAYTVSLDNTSYVYNASNLFAQDGTVLFFANNLDPTTTHILTAADFDASDPVGQGSRVQQCLSIDALIVLNSTSSLPITPATTSTTPSSTPSQSTAGSASLPSVQGTALISGGAIAGMVIGVLVALLLIGLSVWLLRRRAMARRRSAPVEARFSFVSPGFSAQRVDLSDPSAEDDQTIHSGVVSQQAVVGMAKASSTSGTGAITPFLLGGSANDRPPDRKRLVRSTLPTSDTQPQPPVGEDRGTSTGAELEQVSTVDLVQALNRRLHAEQMDTIEEPPDYEAGPHTK